MSHGHAMRGATSPTYNSWRAMKSRCTNEAASNFHHYGGVGVQLHASWLDFENFLADMGERPEGTTLGRYGDTGNYEPGNVAWMTDAEQRANRRDLVRPEDGLCSVDGCDKPHFCKTLCVMHYRRVTRSAMTVR